MSLTPEERAKYTAEFRDYVRRQKAPSELPPSESAGPAGSLAVATGWVPVSSVEEILDRLKERAEHNTNSWYRAGIFNTISDVRAELAASIVRQPAPNRKDEQRAQ